MRSFITFFIALAFIAHVSAEQRTDRIVMQGNSAGSQTVQTDAAGTAHGEYSFNDRGRGDHITASWKLDAAGSRPNMKVRATIIGKRRSRNDLNLKTARRVGKIAPNRASDPSRAKLSISRPIPLRNSPACSREHC